MNETNHRKIKNAVATAHLLKDLVKERTAEYLKEQSDKEFERKIKKK